MRNQCRLHRDGFPQTLLGRVLHSGVDESGQTGFVAGDAESLEVIKCAADRLRTQPGGRHQLVGRQALIAFRIDERVNDAQQLAAVIFGNLGPRLQAFLGFRNGVHLQ